MASERSAYSSGTGMAWLRRSSLPLALIPSLVLLLVGWQSNAQDWPSLGGGAALVAAVGLLCLWLRRGWQLTRALALAVPYLIALGWLWLFGGALAGWLRPLCEAVLVLVPLLLIGWHTLNYAGVMTYRKARQWCEKLAARTDWPPDRADYRQLPEVNVLRDLVRDDAGPAMSLLRHTSMEVRLAGLAVLEGRPCWHKAEVAQVLRVLEESSEPAVRAGVITVLGTIHDQRLVEALAEHLRDPQPAVRQATARVLLADTEKRWSWMRSLVRHALADTTFQNDGSLSNGSQDLGPEVVADLTAWSGEKGALGVRAALTLGTHFGRVLNSQTDPALLDNLRQRVADVQTPAALRLEMAQLLRSISELPRDLIESLLQSANPAPLRLLAADVLLAEGRHPQALATLREIARLPNREIALSTAEVVQRRLSVDLGLARGQPLPALHSRPAAEVTRRVMLWAAQSEQPVPSN